MRVLVRSFGCSTNQADGAVLAGCLVEAGHELVGSVSSADLVVYNTCAVKGPTEDRMIEVCRRVPEGKKLIVAGCLPLINLERLLTEVKFDGVAGPAAGERIVELVSGLLSGEKVMALDGSSDRMPALALPRVQRSSVVSVLPIGYGCLGSCAYCCVVFARGRLRSYGVQEIVERVVEDVGRGFREFWLTSQDTACYGRDIGTSLVELLDSLSRVNGDFRVRVGMMTPNVVMDILDELVEVFRDKKIFKFVHLPVQSGDDQILRRMQRFYSVDDFKGVVDTFRARFPELTVATDVICGFPGEGEENFERTLRLIEEAKPDVVNVSKFFARPRTAAAEMQKDFVLPTNIKRRSGMAAALARRVAHEKNKQWVGWRGDILIDEIGKASGSWVGRNLAYKPVTVKSADNLLGKTLSVRIKEAFPTYLAGEIIK
ncbi:MAG: tRNA (N(6)-L-threonylcarbamoyladenosine(37)-C(2))-methylthiotransferase [Candidatus Bathyarchaeia archaeon]